MTKSFIMAFRLKICTFLTEVLNEWIVAIWAYWYLNFIFSFLDTCFETGANYLEHDILTRENVKSAKDCQSECITNVGCNAWTLKKSVNKCFLKYSVDKVTKGDSDFTSGPKYCEGKLLKNTQTIIVITLGFRLWYYERKILQNESVWQESIFGKRWCDRRTGWKSFSFSKVKTIIW